MRYEELVQHAAQARAEQVARRTPLDCPLMRSVPGACGAWLLEWTSGWIKDGRLGGVWGADPVERERHGPRYDGGGR